MREEALRNILGQLNATSADIQASAVISTDGLMMSSLLPQGLDPDRVGAMSAALLSLGSRVARELDRGTPEQVLVKGDNGYVLMLQAGNDAVRVEPLGEQRGHHQAVGGDHRRGLDVGRGGVELSEDVPQRFFSHGTSFR